MQLLWLQKQCELKMASGMAGLWMTSKALVVYIQFLVIFLSVYKWQFDYEFGSTPSGVTAYRTF